MATYIYQPLQPGSIRLLELAPGKEEESLRGKLVEHKVSQQAEYVALSYYWDPPTFNRTIHLPDPLPLIETLHHALCRARGKTHTVQIWADAVYIDQASIAERNSQVLMMGEIYANVVLVFVDLGSSEGDSPTVEKLCSDYKQARDSIGPGLGNSSFEIRLNLELPPLEDPAWDAWSALLLRPWFTRVWIIREVALRNGSVDVLRRMDSVLGRFCEPLWCYISSAKITN